MSSILVCAMPLDGHVGPMLQVCRILAAAGHDVRFLTGSAYAGAVRAAGGRHVALDAASDITSQMLDLGRTRAGKRLSGVRFAIENTRRNFIATLPGWWDAIERETAGGVDLILGEATVFALGTLAAQPRAERPPIIACGAFPVVLLSHDAPPPMMGLAPRADMVGRIRNRMLNAVVTKVVFGGLQREAAALARSRGGRGFAVFLTEWPRIADAYVQFSVPAFEYPRSDAPAALTYVGPLPSNGVGAEPPEWFDEVESAEIVVHVSQGTLANRDLDELIDPTMRAFADDPRVLVVVATGGRPESDIADPPANARIARMLDYERLMPYVDVFVTNGGYGSLHAALAHGVPIVAAGDTEEKVETCARVAWSGVGVNLRTGTPSSDRVRSAVLEVLADRRYRAAARALQRQIRQAPGAAGLVATVDRVLRAA